MDYSNHYKTFGAILSLGTVIISCFVYKELIQERYDAAVKYILLIHLLVNDYNKDPTEFMDTLNNNADFKRVLWYTFSASRQMVPSILMKFALDQIPEGRDVTEQTLPEMMPDNDPMAHFKKLTLCADMKEDLMALFNGQFDGYVEAYFKNHDIIHWTPPEPTNQQEVDEIRKQIEKHQLQLIQALLTEIADLDANGKLHFPKSGYKLAGSKTSELIDAELIEHIPELYQAITSKFGLGVTKPLILLYQNIRNEDGSIDMHDTAGLIDKFMRQENAQHIKDLQGYFKDIEFGEKLMKHPHVAMFKKAISTDFGPMIDLLFADDSQLKTLVQDLSKGDYTNLDKTDIQALVASDAVQNVLQRNPDVIKSLVESSGVVLTPEIESMLNNPKAIQSLLAAFKSNSTTQSDKIDLGGSDVQAMLKGDSNAFQSLLAGLNGRND